MLDSFAEKKSIGFKPAKGDYFYAKGEVNQIPYYLIKPTTFVNKSGLAAIQFLEEFKIDLNDFLVLCDDVNIRNGELRIRKYGGDGGHNGLASLIYHLNSDQFPRIRIGVGYNNSDEDLADYVLSDFSKEQFETLSQTFKTSDFLLNEFLTGGLKAMLNANSKISNDSSASNNN